MLSNSENRKKNSSFFFLTNILFTVHATESRNTIAKVSYARVDTGTSVKTRCIAALVTVWKYNVMKMK